MIIVSIYIRAFILSIFSGIKVKEKSFAISVISLDKISLRLPEKSRSDFLISFRLFYRLMIRIQSKKKGFVFFKNQSKEAIFDSNLSSIELRKKYIETFSLTEQKLVIGREEIISQLNLIQKFLVTFIGLLLCPVSLILSFFLRKKYHAMLFYTEFVEFFALLNVLKQNNIRKLNVFSIFERDSNLQAYTLMKSGIYVNKIPSEVPLFFFNRSIVADSLSLCFQYQVEEFHTYKPEMFVKSIIVWGPESILIAPKRFKTFHEMDFMSKSNLVAFYSSGNWLREKLGDVDLGHNDSENEELLFRTLVDLSVKNNWELKIYLHPIEKRTKNLSLTNEYYREIISLPNISLGPLDQASIESFDQVNLGISLYSTLMFERIYLGFKTLLAPWGYPDFPLKNSPFKNICVDNPPDLETKILSNLNLNRIDFFKQNQISHYTNYLNL